MNNFRTAIVAAALSGLVVAAPAAAEKGSAGFSARSGASVTSGSGGFNGTRGYQGDDRAFPQWRRDRDRDHRRRNRQISLLGDSWSEGGWIYEHNRTAVGNGYFGQGSSGDGYYDYDRGYPYDYYDDREAIEPRSYSGRRACRTEWVPDGHGEEVPVSICRG